MYRSFFRAFSKWEIPAGREDTNAKNVLVARLRTAFRDNKSVKDGEQLKTLLENGSRQLIALETLVNNSVFERLELGKKRVLPVDFQRSVGKLSTKNKDKAKKSGTVTASKSGDQSEADGPKSNSILSKLFG